eukprot:9266974-Pyramimonas_sp.AAC.1
MVAACIQPVLVVGCASNVACAPNHESVQAPAVVSLFHIRREACCPIVPYDLVQLAPFRNGTIVVHVHQGSRLAGRGDHVALIERVLGL